MVISVKNIEFWVGAYEAVCRVQKVGACLERYGIFSDGKKGKVFKVANLSTAPLNPSVDFENA